MTVTCPKCHKEVPIPDDKPSAVKCPYCEATLALKYRENESSNEPEQSEKASFWQEHKGKIVAGALAIVAVITGGIVAYNKFKNSAIDSDSDHDFLPPSEPNPSHTEIDRYELAVDPWATNDEDEEPSDNIDLSGLEGILSFQEKCPRCCTPLSYYTAPWEDGDNEYGYWTCSRCGKIVYDWASGDDD